MASITKRNNTYLIRISCGFDGNGKRITKCHTYIPAPNMTEKQAEKEAKRQAVLFEEKCRTGQILDNNCRFTDFANKWLEDYAQKQLRPTTLARYKDLIRRILAAFGNMKIGEIQPHHLMSFYDNLAETGVRADIKYKPIIDFKQYMSENGLTQTALSNNADVSASVIRKCLAGENVTAESAEKISHALKLDIKYLFEPLKDRGLSDKTILHHHRLISSIMQTAVQWQVIFSNPCDRVKPPKVERKEARYLDETEAAELLTALEGEPFQYSVMIQLLLYTGLRRGELCGLQWQDVDFATGCLHICRSSLYIADKGIFEDTTKNDASKRVIKLSVNVIRLLQAHKEEQDRKRNDMGTKWQECGRLFTTHEGTPIHPDTVSGWFRDFIKRKGLPDVSIHSLRHTNATLMIASGVSIKTVSSRLGHANISTTGNLYTHAIKSADEAAADTLQNILTPIENSKITLLRKTV